MQTFLISSNFKETAKVLDGQRLVKQNLECRQILNTLTGISDGWKTHPAVLSWKNNIGALSLYGLTINQECIDRGYKGNNEDFFLNISGQNKLPDWFANESIFSSHRGRLKCKGEIDSLCLSIKKHLKIKSIDAWLKQKYKKSKNQLKFADIKILEEFMGANNIPRIYVNYYNKFGWEESMSLEYIWGQ